MKKIHKNQWNKKGLQFRNAFFAILVLGMVVTAIGIVIANWNTYYGSGITYNLGQFDQSASVSSTVEGYQEVLSPKTPDIGNNFESNTAQAVYGVISNLMSPFTIVFGQNGMIDSASQIIGIPDYITRTIITMMILAIVFAIVAIVFRTFRTTT